MNIIKLNLIFIRNINKLAEEESATETEEVSTFTISEKKVILEKIEEKVTQAMREDFLHHKSFNGSEFCFRDKFSCLNKLDEFSDNILSQRSSCPFQQKISSWWTTPPPM